MTVSVIDGKTNSISMMVAAIAALAIGAVAAATPMLTGTAHADFGSIHGLVTYADWGSIHGEFNNPNCVHHCNSGGSGGNGNGGGGGDSSGDSGGDNGDGN